MVSRLRQTGEYIRRRGQRRKRSATPDESQFKELQVLQNRRRKVVEQESCRKMLLELTEVGNK